MFGSISAGPGCPGAIIAILDGPIDLDHPCFSDANIEVPYDSGLAPQENCAAAAHGTHVASIIFGQPGSPVVGIAPRCKGISLPIFASGTDERLSCSQIDLARAIMLALEHSAQIINISGGQLDFSEEPEQFLKDALDRCERDGVLVVAAGGNDGCECPHTPASYPTVLAVGAADESGRPLQLSNWSTAYISSGLLAPGKDILGAVAGGGIAKRTGTSFATPIVSAHAALLLCEQIYRGEKPAPLAVRTALLLSATNSSTSQWTDGRRVAGNLNFLAASHLLQSRRNEMSYGTHDHLNGMEDQIDSITKQATAGASILAAAKSTDDNQSLSLNPLAPCSDVGGVQASCGCNGGGGGCSCGSKQTVESTPAKQIVYALGTIGIDFGTESRRDSISQYLQPKEPFSLDKLINYLSSPAGTPELERLIWTLNMDGAPVYAIQPFGAFAYAGYANLLELFARQEKKKKEEKPKEEKGFLVAIPGLAFGRTRLMSGETVPTLHPSARGMSPWDVKAVVQGLTKADSSEKPKRKTGDKPEDIDPSKMELFLNDYTQMLTRKYRNLGVAGRERALNFASMSAGLIAEVAHKFGGLDLVLDEIEVIRSVACRSGSECYDVRVKMFIPSDGKAAIKVFQFTIDVSDIIPVALGDISSWSERPKS